MKDADSDGDDDFVFYGTPLETEEESRGQYKKDVKDPSITRSLPIWKQVSHGLYQFREMSIN